MTAYLNVFHWVATLFIIYLLITILEVLLRFLENLAAKIECDQYSMEVSALANWFSDPVLGARITPNSGTHDKNGYRNDFVPEKADIVAIGDSQTWGVNAARQDAWPQNLAAKSGQSVYNMAIGFYSMAQYWALIDSALRFSPKAILIGFYFGNDICATGELVYSSDFYGSFRIDGGLCRHSHNEISERIKQAEQVKREYIADLDRISGRGFADRILRSSTILRIARLHGMWPRIWTDFERYRCLATHHPEASCILETPRCRYVLDPDYRLPAMDLDSACNHESIRLIKEMISDANRKCEMHSCRLIFILIPTQEYVFAETARSQGKIGRSYAKLIEMESRCRDELISHCVNIRVPIVDPIYNLRELIAQDIQFYPELPDGHPYAAGYAAIADACNAILDKNGLAR